MTHSHTVSKCSQPQIKAFRTLMLIALAACALTACVSSSPPNSRPASDSHTHSGSPSVQHSHVAQSDIQAALYAQLDEWRGTPYLLGGNTKRGIDCSGFVKQTFAQRFKQAVPRTTLQLAKEGHKINRSDLRAGDLVFFKTGRGVRHVGVYVSDNNFVHASKSAGVTLSNLDSRYWKSRYWQSRRLPMR